MIGTRRDAVVGSSQAAGSTDKKHRSRLVLLAQDGSLTRIVGHALGREFGELTVILEDPVPALQLVRRRLKKLGVTAVLGQVLFRSIAYPLLRWLGRSRIDAIKKDLHMDDSPIDGPVVSVPSVNSEIARQFLKELNPSVVVLSGTRIIGKETLSSIPAAFINMHAGITPLFRGVHGGYWALAEGHPELVGTTVHLVDEGIDTGGIIDQTFVQVSPQDSFATYPYLQAGSGIPSLIKAVRRAFDGELETRQEESAGPSRLRYHPTLWGYLAKRISGGVR